MPITPFLAGQAFDHQAIDRMSAVFVTVCSRLGLVDRTDKLNEVVAKKISELAQCGVSNAETLHKMTLQEFVVIE